jgi:NitT/TauT family transport system permease protein
MRLALGTGLVAVLFFLWWLLTRGSATEAIISPTRLPAPGGVFRSLDALLDSHLDDNIWATMKRILKGVTLAAVIGIGLGLLASSYRAVAAALNPLVVFLRSIPMGALFPLVLLLASDAERQKTTFVFLAIVPFVFSDTFKAVAAVPERYVETAQTLGASRFQIIYKVLFPLALPDIITSLRFQFGLALGYIMLVETNEMQQGGIGAMLLSIQRAPIDDSQERVWMLLFVITALAFVIELTLRFFQRGFFPYRKDL